VELASVSRTSALASAIMPEGTRAASSTGQIRHGRPLDRPHAKTPAMARHPVEDFWAALRGFDKYPPDITPVPELLPGTAAFAASAGLYREPGSDRLPAFPYGGLMIVGHNVDSRTNYEKRRASGRSHGDLSPGPPMRTWVGLYRLLDQAGVGRHQFFFTNVFVGLKEGATTGRFSAHRAHEFRRWCADFLRHQIETMQPRVVLILGVPACREIAKVTTPSEWLRGALPAPKPVPARVAAHDTIAVPASHPSYQKRIGPDAAALRAAWSRESD
jgi:hypothetical protein